MSCIFFLFYIEYTLYLKFSSSLNQTPFYKKYNLNYILQKYIHVYDTKKEENMQNGSQTDKEVLKCFSIFYNAQRQSNKKFEPQ